MDALNILIIGGGIGGLTSAIALRRDGHRVTVVEKDANWLVYGVGIIQQSNVVRAVTQLGILDDYVDAGFGFDKIEVFLPSGQRVADLIRRASSRAIPPTSASRAAPFTKFSVTGRSQLGLPSASAPRPSSSRTMALA